MQVLGERYCNNSQPGLLTEGSTLVVHLHLENATKVSGFNASYSQIEGNGTSTIFIKGFQKAG